jgi:hypothetical protein
MPGGPRGRETKRVTCYGVLLCFALLCFACALLRFALFGIAFGKRGQGVKCPNSHSINVCMLMRTRCAIVFATLHYLLHCINHLALGYKHSGHVGCVLLLCPKSEMILCHLQRALQHHLCHLQRASQHHLIVSVNRNHSHPSTAGFVALRLQAKRK